jgi:probable rRNA maturation factor
MVKPKRATYNLQLEINNRANYKLDSDLIKQIISKFAVAYKIKNKNVSLALVGDEEIKKLNKIYRGLNTPTDVLSFAGEGDFLGEIVIDYNQIKKQASRFDNTAEQEFNFILVHGLLHLLGYNDEKEKDKKEMIRRGEEFVRKL